MLVLFPLSVQALLELTFLSSIQSMPRCACHSDWTSGPMIRLPGGTASESPVAFVVLLPSLSLRCPVAAAPWQKQAPASD